MDYDHQALYEYVGIDVHDNTYETPAAPPPPAVTPATPSVDYYANHGLSEEYYPYMRYHPLTPAGPPELTMSPHSSISSLSSASLPATPLALVSPSELTPAPGSGGPPASQPLSYGAYPYMMVGQPQLYHPLGPPFAYGKAYDGQPVAAAQPPLVNQPAGQTMQQPAPPRRKRSRNSTSAAPPGPIPATTPTLVRRDESGVEWIAFEYSKERIKTSYCIRCDIETVNISTLEDDFKVENCIYPRAAVPPEQYTGNRGKYETECNCIGWCLSFLNPALRGQRGLIQRAVDSWRNTNADPSYRSRRVRRQSKKGDKSGSVDGATASAGAGTGTGTGTPASYIPPAVPQRSPGQLTAALYDQPAFTNPFERPPGLAPTQTATAPPSPKSKRALVARRRSSVTVTPY